MKKLSPFFSSAILFLAILFSCVKAETTSNEHDGRCTGSSSCSACSNCSRCGHCSSGGSCGVCRGSSSGRSFYSAPKKHKKSYRSNSNVGYSSRKSVQSRKTSVSPLKYYNTNDEKTITIETITEITNIRKYPSAKSKIVEKVEKNSILILQENSGKWLKVKVKKSGNIGFVYYKNVKRNVK